MNSRNKKPLFSVVLANYNGEQFIGEAIESVLKQDFEDFEFIIVEDASTDGSRKIVEWYSSNDARIQPIYLDENLGQSHAWNIAQERSRGTYLSFIDSDDKWYPNKLESTKEMFKRNPQAVLCQHNLYKIRDEKRTSEKFRTYLLSGDLLSFLSLKDIPLFVPTTGLSIRSSTFDKIRPIPEHFKVCSDGYMTRTSLCFGEVESTMAVYGEYRVHESNNTFENPDFDKVDYSQNMLIPALREFYEKNNETIFVDRTIQPRKNWWQLMLGEDLFDKLKEKYLKLK